MWVPTSITDSRESVLVSRVIDGDTIQVFLDGESQTIRYIGVDTPETRHPSIPVECYGPEASLFNEELVAGKHVLLEKDTTDQDKYGRLLRYVWIEGVGLVNHILVEAGYARVSTYPPDVKYEALLICNDFNITKIPLPSNQLLKSVVSKLMSFKREFFFGTLRSIYLKYVHIMT